MKTNKDNLKGLIFVISGPSGSGKTTILDNLLKDKGLSKRLAKSVSLTTRPKRSGERNKRDYLFITQEQFRRKLESKKILEWTKYLGYYYATPRDLLENELKKGKHILLCLDLKGARSIKRLYPKNSVTVFVVPPSLQALKERIEGRCTKTKKAEIRKRLKLAREELLASASYDYSLANKNLNRAVKKLKEIILKESDNQFKPR